MRARRILSAVLLAALVATGLSACQSKVGLAAAVNNVRLTDSELSSYIKPGAAPYTDADSTTRVVPKLYVLEAWIQTRVFEHAIAATSKGAITSSEEAAARSFLLGTSQTIGQVEATFAKRGYRNKLGDLVVDRTSVLLVLVQRLVKGTSLAQAEQLLNQSSSSTPIITAVTKSGAKVVLSRRYGTWDPKTLSLSAESTAGLPSFVTVSGAATAAG